jgi:hypothetical protein
VKRINDERARNQELLDNPDDPVTSESDCSETDFSYLVALNAVFGVDFLPSRPPPSDDDDPPPF